MNNQDFQSICSTLHARYDEGRLTDADVDAFADVISNVLGRDELRADDSEYTKLTVRISHDYENDIAMNPLLARMYEICRMYQMFRPRPLTEMERKEEQIENSMAHSKKYPARLSLTDGKRTVASCWWENLSGIDEIADKVSTVAPLLPSYREDTDVRPIFLEAFGKAGAGLDPLDSTVIEEMSEIVGADSVPISNGDAGIIALDEVSVERNRMRKGVEVKLSLDDRTVHMDSYIVYGKKFYNELMGKPEDNNIETTGTVSEDMVSFGFNDALNVKSKWKKLGEVFALPGSDNLVGVKRPLGLG